jgi:hypothetical protein
MDSFIKKIFEKNPTLELDLFAYLMKNDFDFYLRQNIYDLII